MKDGAGNVKLGDFGSSKLIERISNSVTGFETKAGSPYYMSPEVIKAQPYGRKADIW